MLPPQPLTHRDSCPAGSTASEHKRPRPLPTPCCQPPARHGPDLDLIRETVPLSTLLWQSCRRQKGYPFYEAATLLDTLVEHREASHSVCPGVHSHALPVQLSLTSLVPDVRPLRQAKSPPRTVPWSCPSLPPGVTEDMYLRIGQTALNLRSFALTLTAMPSHLHSAESRIF